MTDAREAYNHVGEMSHNESNLSGEHDATYEEVQKI